MHLSEAAVVGPERYALFLRVDNSLLSTVSHCFGETLGLRYHLCATDSHCSISSSDQSHRHWFTNSKWLSICILRRNAAINLMVTPIPPAYIVYCMVMQADAVGFREVFVTGVAILLVCQGYRLPPRKIEHCKDVPPTTWKVIALFLLFLDVSAFYYI